MSDPAAILAGLHELSRGRDPRSGRRVRSAEALLCFCVLTRQAVWTGWTHRDIALASDLPVDLVSALARHAVDLSVDARVRCTALAA